jgi:hypothetical protein
MKCSAARFKPTKPDWEGSKKEAQGSPALGSLPLPPPSNSLRISLLTESYRAAGPRNKLNQPGLHEIHRGIQSERDGFSLPIAGSPPSGTRSPGVPPVAGASLLRSRSQYPAKFSGFVIC